MLVGFDWPTAEVFVNLVTGATLADKGEVVCFGRATRDITNSDQWLAFVEQFGIVSDRIVLLESMTVAQNLAISYGLDIEPVPPDAMARVTTLAAECGIGPAQLGVRVAEGGALLRARVCLARALAFDPAVLVMEHPSAQLSAVEADDYASTVKTIAGCRQLTTIGVLVDERFAKATGGRLLFWQPASGEFREASVFRFWPKLTSRRSP